MTTDILAREVTVCAYCLTAACWQAEFCCEKYKTADTTQKTVRELLNLHLEPPRYWNLKEMARKASEAPPGRDHTEFS